MNYIPVRIREYEKIDGKAYVICDSISNVKLFTEIRDISKVKFDMLILSRDVFKYKIIYKNKYYILVKNGNKIISCKNKKINKWGEYIFKKYEDSINSAFNKKLKRRK